MKCWPGPHTPGPGREADWNPEFFSCLKARLRCNVLWPQDLGGSRDPHMKWGPEVLLRLMSVCLLPQSVQAALAKHRGAYKRQHWLLTALGRGAGDTGPSALGVWWGLLAYRQRRFVLSRWRRGEGAPAALMRREPCSRGLCSRPDRLPAPSHRG